MSRATGQYDKGIGTVCLPSTHEHNSPNLCIATGWGKTNPKGPLSATLRQIRVPLHNNTICKAKYGSSIPIQSSHLCGGKLDGKYGACIVSIRSLISPEFLTIFLHTFCCSHFRAIPEALSNAPCKTDVGSSRVSLLSAPDARNQDIRTYIRNYLRTFRGSNTKLTDIREGLTTSYFNFN